MFFNTDNDSNNVLKQLDILEQYIDGDLNSIEELGLKYKNNNFKKIEEKIIKIGKKLEEKDNDSLIVYGEIMLECEKVSDGFTDVKINAKAKDPKINYISKTLNSMFEKLNLSIENISNTVAQYGDQNYTQKLDVDIFRGGELKSLMESINIFRDKTTENLKISHRESMILEKESESLKDKSKTISKSTQEQSTS